MSALWAIRLGLLLALMGVAASAGAKEGREWTLGGVVEISAEGRVESLELFNANELGAELMPLVQEAARQWSFDTAGVTGEPARLRTTVRTRVALTEGANGPQLEVQPLGFGEPVRREVVSPRYPLEALRKRHNARIVFALRVDSRGTVVEVEPVRGEFQGQLERGRHSLRKALAPFVEASRQAMLQWQYEGIETGPAASTRLVLEDILMTATEGRSPPADAASKTLNGRLMDFDHPQLPLDSAHRQRALAEFERVRAADSGVVAVVPDSQG